MSALAPADARIVRLTAPVFSASEYEIELFAAAGLTLHLVDAEEPHELGKAVRDADIVTVIGTKIPASVIDAMDKCRCIARLGTGTDKIDVERATGAGIVVANTPYFCVEDMADQTMALLVGLARKVPTMQKAMAEGKLVRARHAAHEITRLSASTLGLVGFGRSAVHTARRARGFGMRVLATRQNKNAPTDTADALGVTMTDLETVLRESDYVSLHLPLTPATHHMIDAAALEKMKPTAYLINTSRGALVDEPALIAALKQGRLAGAGLDTHELIDVFTDEIVPNLHPLNGMENVILTPHVSGGSIQARIDMMEVGVQNVLAILKERYPARENIVNPTVVPRFPLTADED